MPTEMPRRGTRPGLQDFRCDGGKWLKSRRLLAGLSQRQLADLVGAHPWTFVSQVETGHSSIMPGDYLAWAAALKMQPIEFVRGVMRFYSPITYAILFPDESDRFASADCGHGVEAAE